MSPYGRTLIFEYSIAYMQKIFPICRDPINKAFYTYHDALRVYFVGSQFLAVLSAEQEVLLGGVIPYNSSAGGTPPPPLPGNAGVDSVERSINCVTHIKETLKTFGQRWEDSKALLTSFEAQSEGILGDLLQRKLEATRSRSSHSPPQGGFLGQPGFGHMRNLSNEDWAKSGVGIANQGLHGAYGHGRAKSGL